MALERPLVFFDLETTGSDAQTDRIVQYSFVKVLPNGEREQIASKVNPQMPISGGATKVHGITDEMVRRAPKFSDVAPAVARFLHGCDLAGYNIIRFDVPVLQREMSEAFIAFDYRKHHLVDLFNIECRVNPRDLATVYRNYTGTELQGAHDATADTLAAVDIYFGQLGRHQLPPTIAELASYSNYDRPILDLAGKFTYDEEGFIIFNFSQHKGKRAVTEPGMLQWMINRGFPDDTVEICEMLLSGGDPATQKQDAGTPQLTDAEIEELPF